MTTQDEWRTYQRSRITSIQSWYDDNYRQVGPMMPPVIGYIVLWAVFNSLYNTADIPNNDVKVNQRTGNYQFEEVHGHKVPKMDVNPDQERLTNIASLLEKDVAFLNKLAKDHGHFFAEIESRIPDVQQPATANPNSPMQIEVAGRQDTFCISDARGIASLDRRVFLPQNGPVLFRYASIDLETDPNNGQLLNVSKFVNQVVFALYQIRNNIVHGGSAALQNNPKELVEKARPVLEDIVEHLFANPQIVLVP